ncbi:hypothetical protein Tco_0155377 [Tanacetum coccineum]
MGECSSDSGGSGVSKRYSGCDEFDLRCRGARCIVKKYHIPAYMVSKIYSQGSLSATQTVQYSATEWVRRNRSLSTLIFLKVPKNSFEVLKLLENSVDVLKILENKLESMKILENKLDSLKL